MHIPDAQTFNALAHSEPDSFERQEQTLAFGIWVFLLSEAMLFGGLILAYLANLLIHPQTFQEGSRELHLVLGSVNTAVLLTSSLFVAVAVELVRRDNVDWARFFVGAALLLGIAFLVIKGAEYYLEYQDDLIPWLPSSAQKAPTLRLFYVFYFFMTGLHALHMVIGIFGLALLLLILNRRINGLLWVMAIALYWHFVDVIWVFLFPILYLQGRA